MDTEGREFQAKGTENAKAQRSLLGVFEEQQVNQCSWSSRIRNKVQEIISGQIMYIIPGYGEYFESYLNLDGKPLDGCGQNSLCLCHMIMILVPKLTCLCEFEFSVSQFAVR